LPKVLEVLIERLNRQTSPADAGKILTGTYVLAGLRMSRDEARQLFGRVRAVQESTTYQAILDEGRIDEAHTILVMLARKKLRAPDAQTAEQIKTITDLHRLHRMCEAISGVRSWKQLLETP
jgi:hypothetical protein